MPYTPDEITSSFLIEALKQGHNVDVIKFVRSDGKMSLKDAREWVERLIQEHFES